MKINSIALLENKYLNCFGSFSIENKICRKYCSLCIRCSIASDTYEYVEAPDDFTPFEGMIIRGN